MKTQEKPSEYELQAIEFCKKYQLEIKVEFSHNGKYFPSDKDNRDIYNITFIRENQKPYTFTFGQSVFNSKPSQIELDRMQNRHDTIKLISNRKKQIKAPNSYDILACIEKNCPDTFEEWCAEMGANTDSITDKKTYDAVMHQWLNVSKMFNESELDELREIQ